MGELSDKYPQQPVRTNMRRAETFAATQGGNQTVLAQLVRPSVPLPTNRFKSVAATVSSQIPTPQPLNLDSLRIPQNGARRSPSFTVPPPYPGAASSMTGTPAPPSSVPMPARAVPVPAMPCGQNSYPSGAPTIPPPALHCYAKSADSFVAPAMVRRDPGSVPRTAQGLSPVKPAGGQPPVRALPVELPGRTSPVQVGPGRGASARAFKPSQSCRHVFLHRRTPHGH